MAICNLKIYICNLQIKLIIMITTLYDRECETFRAVMQDFPTDCF